MSAEYARAMRSSWVPAAAIFLLIACGGTARARVVGSSTETGQFPHPSTEAFIARPVRPVLLEVRGAPRKPVVASIRIHCVSHGHGLRYARRVRGRRPPFRLRAPLLGHGPRYCNYAVAARFASFQDHGRLGVVIRSQSLSKMATSAGTSSVRATSVSSSRPTQRAKAISRNA